ncbi:hypothetical protein EZV62_010461 [Acer yangbiense]|uniref:Uncharacterized protein n=1 Tax=Acer yangbiense TaxID=1000413 RepID=A0A5C7I2A3_9ROSI|nr:hypothetical protein EZV62_010461 [Acer yangbiense]
MKHQNVSAGDGSLAHDSERTIGEKLRQAYDAAVIAVAGDRVQQSGRSRSASRGFERRKSGYYVEDPIRTMILIENDSDLVHGLLEVEDALVGSTRKEKDCSRFDNDRVTLLLRPKPRIPLDMMQNGYCSIVDKRFLYEKYESKFEEGEREGVLDPQ